MKNLFLLLAPFFLKEELKEWGAFIPEDKAHGEVPVYSIFVDDNFIIIYDRMFKEVYKRKVFLKGEKGNYIVNDDYVCYVIEIIVKTVTECEFKLY